MDDILPAEPTLFITKNKSFNAVRVSDNKLVPTKISFKADIIIDDEDSDEYEARMAIGLAACDYWIDHVANNSVMFDIDNVWAITTFLDDDGLPTVFNTAMMLPGEPNDALLASIIQAKLNALANGAFNVGAIEVQSTDSNLSFMFAGDGKLSLPTIEEWIGEHSYFSEPWWNRKDASAMDVVPAPDADLNNPPPFAYSLEFITEMMRPPNLPSALVVRPEFRPIVIQGGRKD